MGTAVRSLKWLWDFTCVAATSTNGKEGAKIGILGQGFSSSSIVKFGGTQAKTITLTGTAYILATIPAGR